MSVNLFRSLFRRNISYALVGESGTGKSYQSKFVAEKYKISYIIDDGLLIKDNRIIAGHSAKEEQTILAAVRASIFLDKSRRDEVARKLIPEKKNKILILGTSEKMVNKIAVRLQIPLPKKVIRIEDFSKPSEIDTAIRIRRVEGKHIIPLPAMEVRKVYPEIFLAGKHIFKGKRPRSIGFITASHEKSLVRPAYSAKPNIRLSGFSLAAIIKNEVKEFDKRLMASDIRAVYARNGYTIVMTIDIPLDFKLEKDVDGIKRYVTENIERFTGILIENVNILIDKIIEKV